MLGKVTELTDLLNLDVELINLPILIKCVLIWVRQTNIQSLDPYM